MLSPEKFNAADLEAIRIIPRGFKVTIFIYALFCIPISFFCGLFGLGKNGPGYWTSTITLLTFFSIALLWHLLKDYIAFNRDLRSNLKLKGEVTVIGKSVKKGSTIIYTDSKDVRKFDVYIKDIFDKIETGDKLIIGISKFSKKLLSLEKEAQDLLYDHYTNLALPKTGLHDDISSAKFDETSENPVC